MLICDVCWSTFLDCYTDIHGDDVCPTCTRTNTMAEAIRCVKCGEWGTVNTVFNEGCIYCTKES